MLKKPALRFVTEKALNEVAIELKLRERIPDWDAIAGYSYTPSNPNDIEEYLEYYYSIKDEDKKFVMIEMIIEANVLQPNETMFLYYWEKVKPILIQDYIIHEYTIHYWKDMTENNFENCKLLTPLIRKVIKDNN